MTYLKLSCAVLLGVFCHLGAAQGSLLLASTTSTEQSGLFAHLLPLFSRSTGISVRVVAVGTGQALDIGRRGDADVVLVHDRAAEEKFVAEGFGLERRDVMFNDFVLLGAKADAAKVRGISNARAAFERLANGSTPFVSRGDKSGTHAAEMRFWQSIGVHPVGKVWYLESGSGMGPSLNMASAKDAYILSDRSTWLSFKNRGNLEVLVQGDPALFNPYGVLLVNPVRHPHVKAREARVFADWLVSRDGQAAIAGFKIEGQPVFFPASPLSK